MMALMHPQAFIAAMRTNSLENSIKPLRISNNVSTTVYPVKKKLRGLELVKILYCTVDISDAKNFVRFFCPKIKSSGFSVAGNVDIRRTEIQRP